MTVSGDVDCLGRGVDSLFELGGLELIGGSMDCVAKGHARGRVQEGDVPPPAQSVEAKSVLTLGTYPVAVTACLP